MGDTSQCAWKLVNYGEFTMGMNADRCGAVARVKILRPYRKTDLLLCERHFNEFIDTWNLHNNVEILP